MAQVNNSALRAMAYAEAQKQGVNPQALEQRLIDRGIDVNTVKMEDIPELELSLIHISEPTRPY